MKKILSVFMLAFGIASSLMAQGITITSQVSKAAIPGGQTSIYTADLFRLVPGSLVGNTGIGNPEEVVRFNITNNTGQTVNIDLEVTVAKDGLQVAYGTTAKRTPLTNGQTVSITNVDFLKSGNYYLSNFSINKSALESAFATTGISLDNYPSLLPNGMYEFRVVVTGRDNSGAEVTAPATTSAYITVFNRTGYTEIVSPGAKAAIGNTPEIFNSFPIYTWIGDANEYELTVWEDVRNSGQFLDAVNSVPLIKKRVTGTSYQHASSDRQLIPGKTYYWQVASFLSTAFRGDRVVSSEPYVFKLANANAAKPKISSTEGEVFFILSEIYGLDAAVLEGATILEYTAVWKNKEVTSQNVDQLLQILKIK